MTSTDPKNDLYLPNLDFVMPMYTTTHSAELEECHQALQSGAPLAALLEDRDEAWVRRACEDSGRTEALLDQWTRLSTEQLLNIPFDALDDFSLAALAQLLFDTFVDGESELNDKLQEMNKNVLVTCLMSPNWSPLLDYDWMFSDVLGYDIILDEDLYDQLMMRSLAHNLRFNGGNQAVHIISEMAEDHLGQLNLDAGVGLYLKLLSAYPERFDVLESAAMGFGRIKFIDVAHLMVERARRLARRLGKHKHRVDDLEMMVPARRTLGYDAKWPQPNPNMEPEILGAFNDVFQSPSNASTSPDPRDFVLELFPNIESVPVKSAR